MSLSYVASCDMTWRCIAPRHIPLHAMTYMHRWGVPTHRLFGLRFFQQSTMTSGCTDVQCLIIFNISIYIKGCAGLRVLFASMSACFEKTFFQKVFAHPFVHKQFMAHGSGRYAQNILRESESRRFLQKPAWACLLRWFGSSEEVLFNKTRRFRRFKHGHAVLGSRAKWNLLTFSVSRTLRLQRPHHADQKLPKTRWKMLESENQPTSQAQSRPVETSSPRMDVVAMLQLFGLAEVDLSRQLTFKAVEGEGKAWHGMNNEQHEIAWASVLHCEILRHGSLRLKFKIIFTYTHTHAHNHTPAYLHTYLHTHTCIYIYTRMCRALITFHLWGMQVKKPCPTPCSLGDALFMYCDLARPPNKKMWLGLVPVAYFLMEGVPVCILGSKQEQSMS